MWLSSWRAPSGETLIFVPPVTDGRRVIVVFMGPTGDADVTHDEQAQPGAEQDDGDEADGTGPGARPGASSTAGDARRAWWRRMRARGALRMGFITSARTCVTAGSGRGPLVPYAHGPGRVCGDDCVDARRRRLCRMPRSYPTMGLCWR